MNVADIIGSVRTKLSERREAAQREATALLATSKAEEERLAAVAEKIERLQREREVLSYNLKEFDRHVEEKRGELESYREGVVVGNLANRGSRFDDMESTRLWNTFQRIAVVKEIIADAPRIRQRIEQELEKIDGDLRDLCRDVEK